ncbi:MAG: hypothetical protein RLY93_09810 [Sumerlaeia bacterium]
MKSCSGSSPSLFFGLVGLLLALGGTLPAQSIVPLPGGLGGQGDPFAGDGFSNEFLVEGFSVPTALLFTGADGRSTHFNYYGRLLQENAPFPDGIEPYLGSSILFPNDNAHVLIPAFSNVGNGQARRFNSLILAQDATETSQSLAVLDLPDGRIWQALEADDHVYVLYSENSTDDPGELKVDLLDFSGGALDQTTLFDFGPSDWEPVRLLSVLGTFTKTLIVEAALKSGGDDRVLLAISPTRADVVFQQSLGLPAGEQVVEFLVKAPILVPTDLYIRTVADDEVTSPIAVYYLELLAETTPTLLLRDTNPQVFRTGESAEFDAILASDGRLISLLYGQAREIDGPSEARANAQLVSVGVAKDGNFLSGATSDTLFVMARPPSGLRGQFDLEQAFGTGVVQVHEMQFNPAKTQLFVTLIRVGGFQELWRIPLFPEGPAEKLEEAATIDLIAFSPDRDFLVPPDQVIWSAQRSTGEPSTWEIVLFDGRDLSLRILTTSMGDPGAVEPDEGASLIFIRRNSRGFAILTPFLAPSLEGYSLD